MNMRTARRRGVECRRFLDVLVLLVCAGALMQAFGFEPFQVPTGSMAPALLGNHRVCTCPRCGLAVAVGRTRADRDGTGDSRYYARAFCPNCGESPLPVSETAEAAGDHVLVNRAVFAFRQPRRWEVIVFRLFGLVFIKRLIGLPGEEILVRDGDVYINDKLARKSFAQAWAMRVPVFDETCRPPSGWDERWLREPADGEVDLLDGRAGRRTWTWCSGEKCPLLRDEYAYNAGLHGGRELVHDFLFEADVEVMDGTGTVALRLCDGQDWVEARLPVGAPGPVLMRTWPLEHETAGRTRRSRRELAPLQAGRRHHVVMAFVDRRLNLTVDGRPAVESFDLPAPVKRGGIGTPVQLEASGTAVHVRNFRLYRDIHYAQRGRYAVAGEPVHLGAEQYFVLGDNSVNSEDSRFWSADTVSEAQLLGPAFFVHLASQPCAWRWAGRTGQCQLPDFARMRWIR